MGLRTLNPTTPGVRGRIAPDFSELTQGNIPLKSLTAMKPNPAGRNHFGRITARFRGGGHKRRFRTIDFRRDKTGIPAKVAFVEYDPNRSARIALLHYADGEKRYILAPLGLKVGDNILAGDTADIKPGNALVLSKIPVGTVIHNVELHPGRGGQFCRAAGAYAQLVAKEGAYALLRMPSGEVRKVLSHCMATIGQVGNIHHEKLSLGKAGRNRWKGRRPEVRGVAMNPVDHPLGGGEGRSSGGRHPCSPWGMPSKGYKTRKPKKSSTKLIVKRRGQK